jgi:cyclopropane fatty-acyl-phospholipid synthase-like methyltransferase
MLEIPPRNDALMERVLRAREEIVYLEPLIKPGSALLDIGCGPGVTSIMLAARLDLRLYLMDGVQGEKRMGYSEHRKAWQDTTITRQLAEANKVQFEIIEPDPSATFEVQFIMSLLSWGHHYPVSTYIELAKRSLPAGGGMVIDLRKGRWAPNALRELSEQGFESIALLDQTNKLERRFFVRGRH